MGQYNAKNSWASSSVIPASTGSEWVNYILFSSLVGVQYEIGHTATV